MEDLKNRIAICRDSLQTLNMQPLRHNIGILLYALNTLDEIQQVLDSLDRSKKEDRANEGGNDSHQKSPK